MRQIGFPFCPAPMKINLDEFEGGVCDGKINHLQEPCMKLLKIVFILLLGLLAACSTGGGTPTATLPVASPTTATTPATAAASPTAAPSPTSLTLPGKVLLVAPPEAGTALAASARAALTDLTTAAKLAFETRPALLPEELKPEFKIVVLLQAPQNLPALLAAAPQTQFVVLGSGELEAKGNLSVIRQREEVRTFMGGYIITLVASDWRSLGLVPDAPAQLQDAFVNGGRYWCGRCVPLYPPVVLFPLVVVQPAATGAAGWQSALSQQKKSLPQAVYLSPAAQSPELVKALFAQKLVMLGTQSPAAEIRPLWAATLRFDPLVALQKLWPGLLAGKGAQSAEAGLSWTDVNDTIFTEGRQRLAQTTLAGVLDGSIGVYSVPDK